MSIILGHVCAAFPSILVIFVHIRPKASKVRFSRIFIFSRMSPVKSSNHQDFVKFTGKSYLPMAIYQNGNSRIALFIKAALRK